MNGRIYDPLLGRFLSADTVVQFPGNLQSFNRYSYVHNNPLTYTDPSGHFLPFLVLPLLGGLTVGETVAASGALAVGTVAATPEGQSAIKQGLTKIGEAISEAAGSVANFFATIPAVPGGGVRDPYAAYGLQMQEAIQALKSEPAPAQTANGQQAAAQQTTTQADAQSTAPQPAVSQSAPAQSSSGGQMNSQEPPNEDQNGGSNKRQNTANNTGSGNQGAAGEVVNPQRGDNKPDNRPWVESNGKPAANGKDLQVKTADSQMRWPPKSGQGGSLRAEPPTIPRHVEETSYIQSRVQGPGRA